MKTAIDRLIANLEKVVVGKRYAIEVIVAGLLAGGHVLIEDVPGVGKTMMVKSLARSTGLKFSRIQFTPDLLPADITGISVYNPGKQDFFFRPGPLMANLVLADEVNRTSPRTQSSLLEAMEEAQVTIDGITYPLPKPFMLLATQNPIDYEGTYPIPESQLDRFMLRVSLGYPEVDEEMEILRRLRLQHPVESLASVIDGQQIVAIQDAVRLVHVEQSIDRYLVQLAKMTRQHTDVFLGASPRATLALARLCQSWALIRGRDYVIPDDVRALIETVWCHRLVLKPEARLRGRQPRLIIQDVLSRVAVPS